MQKSLSFIKRELKHLYADAEIKSFIFLIVKSVCGIDKHAFLCGKEKLLSPDEQVRIREMVADLKNFRPIQYILGETEFYGLRFKVNENVLIPRPETEELVETIYKDYASRETSFSVLDIGTGSGCIAVALAKNLPQASVYAMDIAEKALLVAQENARYNSVKVQFSRFNVLGDFPVDLPEKWDIIVSNPPYITPQEKKTMSKNVLDYEPHQALFTPEEKPLFFYERIADAGLIHLKENGALYFETSSLYGKATAKMLREKGYRSVRLLQDISGKDRVIIANLCKH
ncbi:MAG: peptide chain release factor N(5)-glutamine methyltransferase [Dysgonamonadaceae bacterium]|jgi:release factor glutamine methyltransferase|nr:peptide chain release factor N(5)-glutamine methyltransferase [Dysgonamonadaceae bacterium]